MEIGEQIRALREMKGYSAEQVARISGVNAYTIRRIERGNGHSHFDVVCDILNALDCELVIRSKK